MLTDVGGIPVVQAGGGCNGGEFGGNSWLGMLLVIALLGGGFGAFGGRGAETAAASESHFNQLDSQIRTNEILTQNLVQNQGTNQFQQNLFKELCDLNNNVNATSGSVQREVLQNRFENQVCCCDTKGAIAEAKYENAIIAKNSELAALQCCCETNLHLDRVERNILDRLSQNEIQNLRDRLSEVSLGLSQCRQNEALVSALRPAPVPAYPSCSPYQAYPFAAPFYGPIGAPFADGGCCARF